MKIALVGPGLIPIPPNGYGAVEKHIWHLARSLRARGHEVEVLNELLGSEYTWGVQAGKRLRRSGFEIVHAHTSFLAGYLSRFVYNPVRGPLVYTSHCPLWFVQSPGPKERWGLMWESVAVKYANSVIALAEQMRPYFRKLRDEVRVIPNGVDCELFRPRWPERTGVRICMLGKVIPRKRVHVVAKAVTGVDASTEFHVIGPTPDRDYLDIVKKANINTQFHSGLPESELASLLGSMDVFVHASEAEAMSLAVLEAMASGLPIVHSAAADSVGSAGVRVEFEDDPYAYADAIARLIGNEDERKVLGRAARSTAISMFSWDRIALQVEGVYLETLAHLSS